VPLPRYGHSWSLLAALPEGARPPGWNLEGQLLVAAIGDLAAARGSGRAEEKGRLHCHGNIGCGGGLRKRLETSFAEVAPGLAPYLRADGVREVWEAFLAVRLRGRGRGRFTVVNEWCSRNL